MPPLLVLPQTLLILHKTLLQRPHTLRRVLVIRLHLCAHATPLRIAAATHGALHLDDLALERDDAVSLRAPVRNASRLVQVAGDQGVAQRIVERQHQGRVIDANEVDESWHVLGRGLCHKQL